MLHEILLALSGHPSPLFEPGGQENFPLITSTESALLRKLGRLAGLNRALRGHIARVSQVSESPVCKAVATSIRQSHLTRFQKHILEVEKQILTKDAARVGAYNIVPLASLLGDFEPWTRPLEWLWDLTCLILPPNEDPEHSTCTGAALLDRLNRDTKTGYPDIRAMALDLLAVAERAWLQQLNQWLLQAAHGTTSTSDFFMETTLDDKRLANFTIVSQRAPTFLARPAAESVLFIGKLLGYLSGDWTGVEQTLAATPLQMSRLELAQQLRPLLSLGSPVSQSQLSLTISKIRTSLATQVVHGLLPIHKIADTIGSLREFFLIARPSFVDALVGEADNTMLSRLARMKASQASDSNPTLASITMKEAEVNSVLSRTWAALAPWIGKESSVDSRMEWARDNLQLQISKGANEEQESRFHDLLLATPTTLTFRLRPPLDLFLTLDDVHTYSIIHTYLLSIRRGHLHLTNMWRQSAIRREHPATARSPRSTDKGVNDAMKKKRERYTARMGQIRSMWKTASAAVFVLSELGNYMATEVIDESWATLQAWIGPEHEPQDESRMHAVTSSSRPPSQSNTQIDSTQVSMQGTADKEHVIRDPEVLSQAHRRYLQVLKQALLLADDGYTKILRTFLTHVDYLVAIVSRLQEVQHKVDLLDEGVLEGGTHNYTQEENDRARDVRQAATQVDQDIDNLTTRLKAIDGDRLKGGPGTIAGQFGPSDFVPWDGGGVDRLLMRLDLAVHDKGPEDVPMR
ncbi:hypothetical protein FH972_026078 [Carpinus fangiana]|uniref:Gamma-tubulin complex component n=1 Tax=Carpinus fangiana TaxID=176857 RepID=A0A5N6L2W3_9ROSI|nr:hypothetical protein FH972_026078 [Carpinus fangiana]